MKADAAARQWWAALRPVGRGDALTPARMLRRAHGGAVSLVVLAAALLGCAAVGFTVTQAHDDRLAIARHTALANALDEFAAAFGNFRHIDAAELRWLARRSGLRDLRFAADPAMAGGREIQSLQNANGRIVGWFSWAPDRALIRTLDGLWALAGAAGIALFGCAFAAARTTRRLSRSLASSIEAMRKLSREDALTGLPNQRVMLETLERMLARRGAENLAFALLDLDGLREVNDAVGRAGGDVVLRAIAVRLRAGLPDGVALGRFEDDEFGAIATGDDPAMAERLAAALRACFAEPFAGGELSAGQSWPISAGIGLAQAPEDGVSAEELARRAALALRAAKGEGRGVTRRFAAQIEADQADRRFLLRELKAALAARALDVQYQPIVAAAGGAIIGVEALLRWTHPSRGAIAPSIFVPLAEQYGLMNELGEVVLQRALADAARWPDLFVAVNLSPVQIRDPHIVERVAAQVAQSGIAASRLVLEITEGVLIDDPQEMQTRLEALRAFGVTMALDDFGTGYSSLSYLQKFPFQRLKIDRAFVNALGTIGNAGAIIHSIVTLGHALGMTVLAEGVETDQQRVLLRLAGCDEMQGFLFARPRPAEAIDKIVQRAAARAGKDEPSAAAS